ncbi:MAG: hypothetical protein H6736_04585 [Alphaproteobacteria bacterium]|nr:hypothetical protein [Alphaproteobacteria bacterium]
MWVVWVSAVARAANVACAPAIDEFRHVVDIASTSVATTEDTYRFSVPDGDCSHIELPRALDGAVVADSDLRVADGRLLRKSQWRPGDVLRVRLSGDLGKGPHSAEVLKPAFPVGVMSVQITAPATARLNVWASPEGQVSVDAPRDQVYRAVFPGGGRLVWSSEKDWWTVGDRLRQTIDGKLANRFALGELADNADSLTPSDVVARVSKAVALDTVGPDWRSAANAATTLKKGRGSAAERAIVLLSLLRAAGYDADPVLVRTADAADIPLIVPGYALFTRIAVHVRRPNAPDIWLDPASPYSTPDSVPRELRGSIVLEPGDQPYRLYDRMVPDGTLEIEATATLKDDGSLEIAAGVKAIDGAGQAVRDVLGPLPKSRRQQWLSDLLRYVRPGLEDLRFQLYGVDDPNQPLVISFEFDVESSFRPVGYGLAGAIPPVLAPQLARVLPPNIEIKERVSFVGSEGMHLYGVRPVEDPVDPDAILGRSTEWTDRKARLETLVLRPWRASPRAQATLQVLEEASLRGPELVLFPRLDREAIRALLKEDSTADTRVLEALLWLQAEDLLEEERLEEADRAIHKAVRTGRVRSVADAMRRYSPRGEHRGWALLWNAVGTDHDRLAIVEALERKNELREAWRRANQLVASDDPAIRIAALVAWARTQGPRPPATEDEAGHKSWREPALLLARAEKLADESFPGAGLASVDVALAERLLAKDACDEAGVRIQRAAARGTDPAAMAVLEEWRACVGEPAGPMSLEELILRSRFDVTVMRTAVRTFTRRGETRAARRWAMLAAAVEQDNVALWTEASDAALLAGDLHTAAYAMRRASDLKKDATTTGVPLAFLATLLGDWDLMQLAKRRVGYSVTDSRQEVPITFEKAQSFMLPEQRYAFLRYRDVDVLTNADLLHERFRMEDEAGDALEARRDAAWLAREHKDDHALVELYKATSDALWSTHALEPLTPSLKDPEVRRLRMESALLTGASDPLLDLPYLKEDHAASVLQDARSKPMMLAESMGWPQGLENPRVDVPAGYRSSRLLGALDGVEGFTNKAAGTVLLASVGGDVLPPPLFGVFKLGEVVDSDDKLTIFRLDGGLAPGFVARRKLGDLTFWGAARTVQLARHAVESGIAAQSSIQ